MRYRIAGLLAVFAALWAIPIVLDNRAFFRDLPLNLGFPLAMMALIACVAVGIVGFAIAVGGAEVVGRD